MLGTFRHVYVLVSVFLRATGRVSRDRVLAFGLLTSVREAVNHRSRAASRASPRRAACRAPSLRSPSRRSPVASSHLIIYCQPSHARYCFHRRRRLLGGLRAAEQLRVSRTIPTSETLLHFPSETIARLPDPQHEIPHTRDVPYCPRLLLAASMRLPTTPRRAASRRSTASMRRTRRPSRKASRMARAPRRATRSRAVPRAYRSPSWATSPSQRTPSRRLRLALTIRRQSLRRVAVQLRTSRRSVSPSTTCRVTCRAARSSASSRAQAA